MALVKKITSKDVKNVDINELTQLDFNSLWNLIQKENDKLSKSKLERALSFKMNDKYEELGIEGFSITTANAVKIFNNEVKKGVRIY